MNAIALLSTPPSTTCSVSGAHVSVTAAVERFLAVDRLYDKPLEEIVSFEREHVIAWDEALDAVALRPVYNVADAAAKAQALLASIRREIPDDETEDDLPPQMALAWALCHDLLKLAGRVSA